VRLAFHAAIPASNSALLTAKFSLMFWSML